MATFCLMAEKPKAGRKFSTFMGGPAKLPSVQQYKGNTYKITSLAGHVREFVDPSDMLKHPSPELVDKFKSWDPKDMPWDVSQLSWKKKTIPGHFKYLSQLKKVSKGCDGIIIATDDDPSGEGDGLGWEAIQAVGWNGPVYRIRFSAVTKNEILNAIDHMSNMKKPQNWGKELKAEGRSRWDYLSMMETRIATTAARNAGYWFKGAVNLGRLKSAIMYKIYQRLLARKNYVKHPYFEVRYKDDNGHVYSRKVKRGEQPDFRFDSESQAQQDKAKYQTDTPADVKETTNHQSPGLLLNLSTLDARLSSQGYSSKAVSSTYESMYEDNYVSYPRTADKKITKEQFDDLLPYVDKIADAVGVNKSLLTHRTPRKKFLTKHADHGANRPGTNVPSSLSVLKKYGAPGPAIYKTLAKNYLAMLCEDYEYKHVTADLADHKDFKTSFNVPVKMNYKEVFYNGPKSKSQSTKSLGQQAAPFIHKGANPKPGKPTKTWISNWLSKVNVGTGATRIQVMGQLTSGRNKKIKTNRSNLTLTKTANGGVTCAYMSKGTYLSSALVTKQLNDIMDEVESGKQTVQGVESTAIQTIKHDKPVLLQNAKNLNKIIGKADKKMNNDTFDVQHNGQTEHVRKNFMGNPLTDTDIKKLKANQDSGKPVVIKEKSKKGTSYFVKAKLGEHAYKGKKYFGVVNLGFADDPNKAKQIAAWKKKKANRPTATVNGKKVQFSAKFFGKPATSDEIAKLSQGKTVTFTRTSAKGNQYKVKGKVALCSFKGHHFYGIKNMGFAD